MYNADLILYLYCPSSIGHDVSSLLLNRLICYRGRDCVISVIVSGLIKGFIIERVMRT